MSNDSVRTVKALIRPRLRGVWSGSSLSAYARRHVFTWRGSYSVKRPVSILYKSIAGRYRPIKLADGPIMALYRFIKNASWENFGSTSLLSKTCQMQRLRLVYDSALSDRCLWFDKNYRIYDILSPYPLTLLDSSVLWFGQLHLKLKEMSGLFLLVLIWKIHA